MKQPDKAHAAWKRMLARENVRASVLRAKHRQITARIARMETQPATLIQLELPLGREEKTA